MSLHGYPHGTGRTWEQYKQETMHRLMKEDLGTYEDSVHKIHGFCLKYGVDERMPTVDLLDLIKRVIMLRGE